MKTQTLVNENPSGVRGDVWSRPLVFGVSDLRFPYLYRFPGQEKNEQILYVTREAKILLWLRCLAVLLIVILIAVISWVLGRWLVGEGWLTSEVWSMINGGLCTAAVLVAIICWWWMGKKWRQTVGILTTYRLVKLVQTSPFNKQTQTLGLKEVVDTSSSSKGFKARLLGYSTLTARSSATSSGVATDDAGKGEIRVNKKYFYLENIANAGDLEHYLQKVIKLVSEKSSEEMKTFRPFAPNVKAGKRDWLKSEFPEYWD